MEPIAFALPKAETPPWASLSARTLLAAPKREKSLLLYPTTHLKVS